MTAFTPAEKTAVALARLVSQGDVKGGNELLNGDDVDMPAVVGALCQLVIAGVLEHGGDPAAWLDKMMRTALARSD